MNKEDTATAGPDAWPDGMAVELTLQKKLGTPLGATSDPLGVGITLTGCRKRGLTSQQQILYASVIGMGRSRLFEIWPAYDDQPLDIVSNGDTIVEDDGQLWIVRAKPESVFDNVTLALCVPE